MTLLMFQIAVVLLVTLLCGWVARQLRQSRVIGEIVGGILLGPSVFARVSPHAWSVIFPASSLAPFDVLSTLGLILFLFLIGSEVDLHQLRENKGAASLTSLMSIVTPFAMAAVIAHPLRRRFAPQHVGGWPFFLFLGISLSITAFPILARIIEERKLQGTALGTTALMCAAFDDLCGWSLLAIALTLVPTKGPQVALTYRFLGLGLYIALMLGVFLPLSQWLAKRYKDRPFTYEALGVTAVFVLGSAAATDALGVHPLFGAFMAGLCFPRIPAWQQAVRLRLDMIVSVLLLPLFFALTGMKTRLDLLHGASVWFWTAVVLVMAVAGKVGGAVLGARWSRLPWRQALALGALMNARGLIELIVLNIAYNAHVFSPELFTMLVLMALITTMLTVPLLNWIGYEAPITVPKEMVAAD